MEENLQGVIPPIVTPFKQDGSVDVGLLREEISICLEAGVDGISVGGSTGEGPALDDGELGNMVRIAREMVPGEKPLVCGVMRMSTRDAVRTGLEAKKSGASAIMVTPTAYNVLVPNEEGMFGFYSDISREVRLPIIIYNVIPQNFISPALFKRLLESTGYVMGIKQSTGGIEALYADIMTVREKGAVYAATDDMMFSCFELGAAGAISAILSLFPSECCQMWKHSANGEHEKGLEIQSKLYSKWQPLKGNQFPIRLKYALELMGRNAGYCRGPITYLPEEEKQKIREALLG